MFIVRHGSTKMNSDQKIRGWDDVPLDEEGLKQAEATGEKMKKEKLDGIISSDLIRARQTAEAISRHTGAPILDITDGLRPWSLGYITGQNIEDTLPAILEFIENPDWTVDKGESFNDFKNRFLDKFDEIQAMGKNIAIVAHHRNDRLLAAWEKKGMPENREIDASVMNGEGIEPGDYRKISESPTDLVNFIKGKPDKKKLINNIVRYSKAKNGKDGYTPVKGKDYFDGKDGYTPIKGEDYFTDEEIKEITKQATPIKGKDYFDGKDGENIKGDKGDKGDTGINPEPKEVIEEIKKLKGDDRIPLNAIKGSEWLKKLDGKKLDMSDLRWHGGGGAGNYDGTSPTNVTVGGLTAGTDISGWTLTQILQTMLVTYLTPTTTLSSIPAGGLREKGNSILSVGLSSTNTKNSNPITSFTYSKSGVGVIYTDPAPNPAGGASV